MTPCWNACVSWNGNNDTRKGARKSAARRPIPRRQSISGRTGGLPPNNRNAFLKTRDQTHLANSDPQFADINPRVPPRVPPPVEPLARRDKPRLDYGVRGSRSQDSGRKTQDSQAYPAPNPNNPPIRTAGESSISTERVTLSVRMRFNPLRGLTPDRLAQYLDQFDLGFFRLATITWDRLERRDYKIRAVAPKRKKAVARHGWEVVTVDGVAPEQKELASRQARALAYFYDNLATTDALRPDVQGGLALLVRQMMDAVGKYYAVHEIVWRPGVNSEVRSQKSERHSDSQLPSPASSLTAQFVFCPLWWFEGVTGKLRYLDNEFQVYGRDMRPSEWLVTCGDGLMEACSVAWMFKHLALQDWLTLCEKWGQPFIDAATSSEPGSPEWEALLAYVRNFGPDGGGVRSQGSAINTIESRGAGNTLHEKMVENMDRALTILWRGGDLGTTSARNQTGASLQEEESEILETDDATIIEETLAAQVSRYVIAWTFGGDAPVLAYLKFRKQEKKNVELDLAVDTFLLNAGAPLAITTTLERYGRPVPPAGEALLKPAGPLVAGTQPPVDSADSQPNIPNPEPQDGETN